MIMILLSIYYHLSSRYHLLLSSHSFISYDFIIILLSSRYHFIITSHDPSTFSDLKLDDFHNIKRKGYSLIYLI